MPAVGDTWHELEAIGAGGGKEHLEEGASPASDIRTGQGGVTSSKVGCLAPCYFQAERSDTFVGGTNGPQTILDIISKVNANAKLLFDTTNRPPMDPTPPTEPGSIADGEYRLGVTYQRTSSLVDTFKIPSGDDKPPRYRDGDEFDQVRALGTNVPPAGDKTAVRVTAGQDGCIIFNTDTGDICLDSRKPIGEQKSPC